MTTMEHDDWLAANQRYLAAAVAEVGRMLDRAVATHQGSAVPDEESPALEPLSDQGGESSALERLCVLFDLSPFERDVLVICAGMELDARFAGRCAAAQGDPLRPFPTFSLALATLPGAHWTAVSPAGPLRRWRLIEIGAGPALTTSPLRIDERVLHYLAGASSLDERLEGLVAPLSDAGELPASHRAVAETLARAWAKPQTRSGLPVVQLCGPDTLAKRAIAAAACASLGLGLREITPDDLPATPTDHATLRRLWEREAALDGLALLLNCEQFDEGDPARMNAARRFIGRLRAPLIVTTRERQRLTLRPTITFEVQRPSAQEQRTAWQSALGEAAAGLNGHVERLVSQFSLSSLAITTAADEALGYAETSGPDQLGRLLWDACVVQARARLDDLAQRIEPASGWDELVLPESQLRILREVAAHVRQRATVYDSWGFAGKGARGLGISALFAGASGTGKTLAAEVLAHELRLDLYRIDLSSVVSKYIGETEKNLRRVFDAAEEGGAILLFDEADALFGKRSEVKDSHDRYANIEVSYLLQRMEAYRGLAILTTNLRAALDVAFLRRIRFIVQFPFPDATQRAEIWRRIFPSATPTKDLDVRILARLNVAGGNIRNIALNAAFLAADAEQPVTMAHLLQAARAEYSKLEKPLTETELAGWA